MTRYNMILALQATVATTVSAGCAGTRGLVKAPTMKEPLAGQTMSAQPALELLSWWGKAHTSQETRTSCTE
jgi:hypothetical protein